VLRPWHGDQRRDHQPIKHRVFPVHSNALRRDFPEIQETQGLATYWYLHITYTADFDKKYIKDFN
jgi:hypothetical protein